MEDREYELRTIDELMANINDNLLVDEPLFFMFHEKIDRVWTNAGWVSEKRRILPCTEENMHWLINNRILIKDYLVSIIQKLGKSYCFIEVYNVAPSYCLRYCGYKNVIHKVFKLVRDEVKVQNMSYQEAIILPNLKKFLNK